MGKPGAPGGASSTRACAEVNQEVVGVLNDLLDKIALRTPMEMQYLVRRCTHVDDEGTRCAKWGAGTGMPRRCIAHGGKTECLEQGCTALVNGIFCPKACF